MRKKIFVLAVTVIGILSLAACGQKADDTMVTTPTLTAVPTEAPEETVQLTAEPVPTKAVEQPVEPTKEPTSTEIPEETEPTTEPEPTAVPEIVEPTATPEPVATPAPTATPEPTSTPAPTATPEPTKAPETAFKTVLRELHSLKTYEEREAYIEKLDKSKYKVEETKNLDFFSEGNSYEGFDLDMNETRTFTPDALHRAFIEFDFVFYDDLYEEYDDFEARYGYSSWLQYAYEYSLMTITDVTTGEIDPWGAKALYSEERLVWDENWEEVIDTEIVEIVHPTIIEPVIDAYNSIFAWDNFYYYAMIKTWDTLQYYDDIYTPQTEFETGHN